MKSSTVSLLHLAVLLLAFPIPNDAEVRTINAASAAPVAVSGYTSFSDPLEQAFTMQVPSGWKTVGGLARRAALQINPFVRSLSPDKRTCLIIGEPTLPGYVPPNQMRNTLGYREGKMFDSGLGGLSMVLHSMSGTEFARIYGQTAMQGLCTNLRFTGSRERSDMAGNADRLVPTVIPSISTGGEARFSCMHGHEEMEARTELVTRATRDDVMCNVIFLKGFIAPKSQADKAEEILTHVGASFKFNAVWSQRRARSIRQPRTRSIATCSNISARSAPSSTTSTRKTKTFSSMDDIVSGYSTYHGAATGNDFKLSNTSPYKWADGSTGRIISTPTNIQPAWGSYRPMPRAS